MEHLNLTQQIAASIEAAGICVMLHFFFANFKTIVAELNCESEAKDA